MSQMKSKEKTLWHDGLQYDLLLGIALELIVLFVSILFWHMQFPKLAVAKAAILNLLYLVLALPLLVGIFGLSARSMENAFWTRLFTRLAWPSLLAGILATLVLCLIPPYCSGSTKPKQYMKIDQGVDKAMVADLRQLFPETILPTAGDVSYQYYKYTSILENSLHISLGETLDEAGFQREAARIDALSMLTSATRTEGDGITLIDLRTPEGLTLHLSLDAACHRIIYSASCQQH